MSPFQTRYFEGEAPEQTSIEAGPSAGVTNCDSRGDARAAHLAIFMGPFKNQCASLPSPAPAQLVHHPPCTIPTNVLPHPLLVCLDFSKALV